MQSVYTDVMGCIMGLIYYKTRNIFYTILIHIINNTIGNLPPALNTDAINTLISNVTYLMIIPGIILLILLCKEKPANRELAAEDYGL